MPGFFRRQQSVFRRKRDMTIAFDGKKAARNRAGLGNYSRFVITTLARRFPDVRFDVYVSRRADTELLAPLMEFPNVTVCYPTHPVLKYFPWLWEKYGITYEVRRRGADVYHGLGNELPANIGKASRTRTVVTIHDLIFLFFPHTYSWIDRHLLNLKFRSACRRADRIIAVSRCTARDIVKYYFTPKSKISVAYQGCDQRFREECPESLKEDVRKRYSLPDRFILSVGTVEERKNTALIVKALPSIPEVSLVIVGKRTAYAAYVEETARECKVSGRVRILTGVSTSDLAAMYRLAEVFVYPSRYEGFGIPMLEALCSGVPAIGATGSCLEEAGGDASLYTDPDSAENLAQKIVRVLTDRSLRKEMIERGHQYASGFTGEVLADRLMEIYRECLESR